MLPEEGAQPPEYFQALLKEGAPSFGLELSRAVLEPLGRFLSELDRARRRTNLTGPVASEELVEHALESALGEQLIPHGARVIDIGSGAGFPGVPLAIVRPDIEVAPVEPRRKRIEFLEAVSRAAGISNFSSPTKSLGQIPDESADVATARAVGGIERLLRDPRFLRAGGFFLAWTTDVDALSRHLAPLFRLDRDLPVPKSRRKRIARFRREEVPRGTASRARNRG
ncbi:MAG TPA: 16S rRNA (guanine(527)-N(7))-methyltransferase RsmG, partial [Thermoanaerobaculia bacterium]